MRSEKVKLRMRGELQTARKRIDKTNLKNVLEISTKNHHKMDPEYRMDIGGWESGSYNLSSKYSFCA